jgi:glycerol uptake facilitator-like aquaporin
VAASWLSRLALGTVGSLGATIPAVPLGAAFGVEVLLSFLLMLVIMAARNAGLDSRMPDAGVIGLTVGCCALVGGPLTGASMNPARSLGPALVGGYWVGHWLYWLAPIGGMLAAARSSEFLGAAPVARSP